MAALANILEEVFVRCFPFEANNNYLELLEVIKNR